MTIFTLGVILLYYSSAIASVDLGFLMVLGGWRVSRWIGWVESFGGVNGGERGVM